MRSVLSSPFTHLFIKPHRERAGRVAQVHVSLYTESKLNAKMLRKCCAPSAQERHPATIKRGPSGSVSAGASLYSYLVMFLPLRFAPLMFILCVGTKLILILDWVRAINRNLSLEGNSMPGGRPQGVAPTRTFRRGDLYGRPQCGTTYKL